MTIRVTIRANVRVSGVKVRARRVVRVRIRVVRLGVMV